VIAFPFDLESSVKRVLGAVSPSVIVIVESEFWPVFLRACHERRTPVILLNGHFSEKHYPSQSLTYRLLPFTLKHFTLLLMQSRRDADGIVQLGADPERVMVVGNLRFDFDCHGYEQKVAELNERLGLTGGRLIVAGSVRPGEEEQVVGAFAEVIRLPGLQDVRLLLAPRNPARCERAEIVIRQFGLSWVRRSQAAAASGARSCQVILLDTLGELAALYAMADIAFVGGSLIPEPGGHNILEPALFSKPIVVGPYTWNVDSVVEAFRRDGALIQLSPPSARPLGAQLVDTLLLLLEDPIRRQTLGQRARSLLERHRGGTEATFAQISRFL
jgi:3-deoxy-D-manno-octulosonic-acid transferase